mmetsp:Transcript_62600/g.99083  ORF Transcript_62600/g.99083 Transcript_62600/m.99083 type:complete len:96 (+) Transcript_62600:223-510(+)
MWRFTAQQIRMVPHCHGALVKALCLSLDAGTPPLARCRPPVRNPAKHVQVPWCSQNPGGACSAWNARNAQREGPVNVLQTFLVAAKSEASEASAV